MKEKVSSERKAKKKATNARTIISFSHWTVLYFTGSAAIAPFQITLFRISLFPIAPFSILPSALPSSLCDVSLFIHSFSVGANDPFVTFYARSASYLLFQGTRCCPNTARLTLTMWLKLAELPAILFSTEKPLSSDKVALTIDSNGTLSFLLNNASIRYETNR